MRRASEESGFGLVELLIAMTITAVALLTLIAALTSGTVALRNAARKTTAAALADARMERYRAISFSSIGLSASALATANGDSVYTGDSAWNATQLTAPCTTLPDECRPTATVTGADGRSYRVDAYIVSETPVRSRQIAKITVVVRDPAAPSATPLARVASTVDAAG